MNRNGKRQHHWRLLPLGIAAEVTMGSSPPGETYNEEGRGVPLVNGPVEFSEGDFGLTIRGKYTTEPTRMCRANDLLLCVRGSTTGRTNIAGFDACIGRGVASIRSKEDQRFLNHFIRTQRQRIFDLGNGSTFPSITQEQLVSVQVPLPPLPEQKRIADILDKADAIRRKRREVSASLGDYPLALFMQLFGHPDPNPKDWPMLPFSKVCDSRLGKMLDAKQQTGQHNRSYMRNLNVQWGRLDLSHVFEMDFDESDREEFRLKYGDVLVCEGGAGVGQTAIWRDEIPECYFQKSLHRVRPLGGKATPEYIAFLMWTLMNGSSLLRSISSATIPHLTGEKLKDVRIPVPPLKLQQHFSAQCQRVGTAADIATTSDCIAKDLFNSLVQQAFRGDL